MPNGAVSSEPIPTSDASPQISLHLDNVDVRKALEMLSRQGSLNILVSPGVSGTVTINLEGMDFDSTLGAILRLCDLVARREGRLIYVYAPNDVPQSERTMRSFPLDYVSGVDVLTAVQSLLSPTGQAFVSESSSMDNRRTREVITVDDLPENLQRVEQYLYECDLPPRQVLIEAHVLEVELNDDCVHGVNFEHLFSVMNNGVGLELTGLANPMAPQAFFINLGGGNLTALVEMLKTTTDAKTLASPRVLVLNGQEARIQIGERLGYRTTTVTETSSVQDVKFLELGVVLTVTPRISRDDRVMIRVVPQISSGDIDKITELPEEETTTVETDVLLENGQGIVIGGLIKEKQSNIQSKIPWLGDVWLLGVLFQRRAVQKKRSEIIVALVPRVLPYYEDYAARDNVETMRATTPLVVGPLCTNPRPWEPRLRDAVHNPRLVRLPPIHGPAEHCPPLQSPPQLGH